ncbi:polypeptide N-acetylgalactosaminyltransferase 1-like [Centruroides sculpturatus]|uniref:polypeptide N-acetylgalactosaminyltransferase 1-like n=1 Tax=Centruroides sculpturatus TaxID=218467 RepID=UPI000C6EE278|nr:polypeptide N-acetylgalactosaminyltransferase 1-like [Centruroides sculpturatus]
MLFRRRKLTLLKLVLIFSIVICILFWLLQVRRNDLQNVNEKNEVHVVEFKSSQNEISHNNHIQDKRASELKQNIHKSESNLGILQTKSSRDKKNQMNMGILKHPEEKPIVSNADDIMNVIPGLGENGVAVHLSKKEQKEADKLFNQAAFNVYLSNRISLNRSVPDPRHPMCKSTKYDKDLPSTSVVIIFTNEIWSELLRTIYSVLNRTPNHLLKEIILVDDASDRGKTAVQK